jgi:hypothetical protein
MASLLGAEVVVVAQPQDLLHHLRCGGGGPVVRGAGAIPVPVESFLLVAAQPLIVVVPIDAVVEAGGRDDASGFLGSADHGQPVLACRSRSRSWQVMAVLPSSEDPTVHNHCPLLS